MKVTIAAMPVPEDRAEFAVQLRSPGKVRAVAFALQPKLLADARGLSQFTEQLTMYIEVAPDGPLRNRRFAIMRPGACIAPRDGQLVEFVGTAISGNTGQVAHVYEVKEAS